MWAAVDVGSRSSRSLLVSAGPSRGSARQEQEPRRLDEGRRACWLCASCPCRREAEQSLRILPAQRTGLLRGAVASCLAESAGDVASTIEDFRALGAAVVGAIGDCTGQPASLRTAVLRGRFFFLAAADALLGDASFDHGSMTSFSPDRIAGDHMVETDRGSRSRPQGSLSGWAEANLGLALETRLTVCMNTEICRRRQSH